jgi:hypothetical protein
MKQAFRLIVFLLLLLLPCLARAASPTDAPFEPIAFLVGGVWRGDLPPARDGAKMAIELRAAWLPNHQGIRFDGSFVTDGQRRPYTSGSYFWNPAKRQLVFSYSDNDGSLVEGTVANDAGALRHDFTVIHADGKVEQARAIITPSAPNRYTNDIMVEKNNSWQKMVSVAYTRTLD